MEKLEHIYRPVKIEDYNRAADAINALIDKLESAPTYTAQLQWDEQNVEDTRKFTSLDIPLPYERSITITDLEALEELSNDFNLPYELSKTIIDYLGKGIVPVLNIHFEESPEVKDIVISNGEISLDEIQEDVKPKKGRKKKDGTTKQARSTAKKDSRAGKKGVGKRKT